MSGEDDSILGNLPRSRPGTRSNKRSASKSAAAPSAARKPATKKPSTSAKSRSPAAGAKKGAAPLPPEVPRPTATTGPAAGGPPVRNSDPVGDVVRAAEALATTSVRVATSLAGEALRRLSGR